MKVLSRAMVTRVSCQMLSAAGRTRNTCVKALFSY
jgi:hypothetical protein